MIIKEGTLRGKKNQNMIIWGEFLVYPDCRRIRKFIVRKVYSGEKAKGVLDILFLKRVGV